MRKVAISGTGSGFGQSLSRGFVERGYSVISIGRSHHSASSTHLDFSLESLAAYPIDFPENEIADVETLVINAYVGTDPSWAFEVSGSDLMREIQLNLLSTKFLLDAFLKNSSNLKLVVEVSSGASIKGYQGWLGYCTTKASTASLFRVYQAEFSSVMFRSVSPGPMKTPLNQRLVDAGEDFEWHQKLIGPKVRDPDEAAADFISACESMRADSPQFLNLSVK